MIPTLRIGVDLHVFGGKGRAANGERRGNAMHDPLEVFGRGWTQYGDS